MSLLSTLILSAALAAGAPGYGADHHVTRIDHRGATYDVTYRPRMEMRMKTIGSAVGPRASGERCRWTIDVAVSRIVRRAESPAGVDTGHERLLPSVQRIEGTRFGNCRAVEDAVRSEQMAKLDGMGDRLARLAERDRVATIADIDAAHALAVN